MSGMASTSVYSKYYTFYMDTGMTVSVATSPVIEGIDSGNDHQTSNYFEDREKELRETASHYMAVIDLWIEDEITTYKTPLTDIFSKKESIQLSYLCNVDENDPLSFGEQTITLSLKDNLPQEEVHALQERLCSWKTKNSSKNYIPIDIASIERVIKDTSFGLFTAIGGNLRTDVALNWNKYQQNSLEQWVLAVQSAITSIENKFEVKILSSETDIQDKDMAHGHRINASWGPVFYTTWFVEEDKQYAEEIKYAIPYYIQEQEYSSQLIDTLPLDTREYLDATKDIMPISAVRRQEMKDEIVKIENELQNSFNQFGISISINIGKSASYSYDWDAVQRLHDNLALFNRLLSEANEIGKKMKNNAVHKIEFSNQTWDNIPNKLINMTLELNSSRESAKWSIDIHFDELKQKDKEQEFYEILLGERDVSTDIIDIKIL